MGYIVCLKADNSSASSGSSLEQRMEDVHLQEEVPKRTDPPTDEVVSKVFDAPEKTSSLRSCAGSVFFRSALCEPLHKCLYEVLWFRVPNCT